MDKHWNTLGDKDPLWAVLTEPGKSGRRWDPEQFLATGRIEIAELMTTLDGLDLTAARGAALDFGCGAGRLTQGLVDAGFEHVTGVDISQPMLSRAQELNRHGDRCTFLHNDAPTLPAMVTDSVDLVYCCRVLQHLPPPLAHGYLAEFFRVTRPGGVVVFQMPARPAPGPVGVALRLLPAALLNRLRRGMEMHGSAPARVSSLVEAAGGRVDKVADDQAAGPRWVSHTYYCRA